VDGDFHVLGSSEIVLGFAYAGVAGTAVETREEALAAFLLLTGQDRGPVGTLPAPGCRVLILTEDVAGLIEEEVIAWQLSGEYPLLVEVPPLSGKVEGRRSLMDAIRDAIGVRV
jgi:V/A-type H+-transporting ATPase subunit F